jgi:hypothetical protein
MSAAISTPTAPTRDTPLDASGTFGQHPTIGAQGLSRFSTFLAAALFAVALIAGQAATAPAAMYWGATISGEPYGHASGSTAPADQSAWDLFERHAGRKVALLNTGQPWVTFDKASMDAAWNRGAIPVVVMPLGAGVTLEQVASGGQDAAIESWAAAAKAWGHPFMLAPWWEMNGNWYPWGRSTSFVPAWQRFHDLVEKVRGATNVTWTWVSNSIWDDPLSDPAPYYPGDAYVDWTGIDSYNWGLNLAQPDRWLSPDQTLTPTLAAIGKIAPSKPVLVLESAASELGGNKAEWIAEMLGTYLPHHPQIKGYMWFNWNFKGANGQRFDWPIETSAPAQQAFRRGIQSSVFRSARPSMPNLTKVPAPPALSGGDGPHPADISAAGQDTLAPQVAVAPDGTSTVVWSAQAGGAYGVYARRIAPDGLRGQIVQLSPAATSQTEDALAPQVAVAPDGSAVVVWIRSDGANFVVQARWIAPDGTLGETQGLSATGQDAAGPQVAISPDGVATVVWKRFNGAQKVFVVKERRIDSGGPLGETQDLSVSAAGKDAVDPQVAVSDDGTATVVWSRYDGSNSIVQARRVAPNGTLEAAADLSAAGQNAVQPQVAVAPDGTAAVVWVRSDGSNAIVQERRIGPSGTLGPANDLSATGRDSAEAQIALGPDGSATVVWERFDGTAFVVQSRRVDPGGSLGTTRTLSDTGRDAAEPQVSVAPDGSATVVWSRFDGLDFRVQRRALAPDGTPAGAVATLSASGHGAGFPQPASGARAAVWTRFDGVRDVVQSADPDVPEIPGSLLTPASHDFGSVLVGSGGSAATSFEFFNSGNAPLTVTSIALAGRDAGQFALGGTGSCTGAALAPGASCLFSAAFNPSSPGVRQAGVEVFSNAASSPDAASLSGSGVGSGAAAGGGGAAGGTAGVGISNAFTIGRPILNRRKGTARLPVTLPGPGTLSVTGSGSTTLPVAGPGTVKVRVRARGRKAQALNRHGRVALKLSVSFEPRGGLPRAQTVRLRLRKAR